VRQHRGLDPDEHSATIDVVMADDQALTLVDAHPAALSVVLDIQTHERGQTNPGVSDPSSAGLQARASGGVAHARVCVLSQRQTRMAGGTERRPVSSIQIAAILRARRSYHCSSGPCSSQWMRFEHARRPTAAEDDLHTRGRPPGRPRPYVRFGRSTGASTARIRRRRRATRDGSTGG